MGKVLGLVADPVNENIFYTSGEDGMISSWDIESGEYLQNYVQQGDAIATLEITEDGRLLVGGDYQNTLYLFKAE